MSVMSIGLRRTRTTGFGRWRGLALVGAIVLLGVAAVAFQQTSAASARTNVESYQAGLQPLTQRWGKLEILGMRPAVADLQDGTGVPAPMISAEADAWHGELRSIQTGMQRLDPPPALQPANAMFEQALQKYLDAARTFGQAAAGPPSGRDKLIQSGASMAHEGDVLYNRASMLLQKARTDAGLPTTSDYPDHPAS
jgi:hypothetical protein